MTEPPTIITTARGACRTPGCGAIWHGPTALDDAHQHGQTEGHRVTALEQRRLDYRPDRG